MALACLLIFVGWMYRCRRLWTNRACVCIAVCLTLKLKFAFDAMWGHNLIRICCQNIQQWHVCLHGLDVLMPLDLDEQEVRLFCCVVGFETEFCVRCGVGHNPIPIHYRNIQQRRDYLRWMDVPMPLALDEQHVRLYCCVIDFETECYVRCGARPWSNVDSLSKYTTIVRLSSLNACTDVVGSGRAACSFALLCHWLWNWILRSMRCGVII